MTDLEFLLSLTADDIAVLKALRDDSEQFVELQGRRTTRKDALSRLSLTEEDLALVVKLRGAGAKMPDVDWLIDQMTIADDYDPDAGSDEDYYDPDAGVDDGPDVKARKRKLLVIGHGRHGKDTVCEMLRDQYGYTFVSSSWFCAEKVVMPYFEKRLSDFWSRVTCEYENEPIRYRTVQECYDDRANHRAEWYTAIREFNTPDATRLGRAIWAEYDIYGGLRSHTEFNALRNSKAFDVCIWVDASDRLPPEDRSSMTLEPWMADYILDNNGTVEDLRRNLDQLMATIHGD